MASQETSFTLIERVRNSQSDDRYWEEFVESYRAYIYVIIRNFNLSDSLCEDLLQEVLLQLWKDPPKLEYRPNQCRFRTWLSLVTCNVVKTWLKSKAGKRSKKEAGYEESLHALERISEPEIEVIAEKEWKVFIAEKALANLRARLPEKLLKTLEAFLDDVPDCEVAAQLQTSEASVRVYRQRAKNALKKEVLRLNTELDC